MLDFEGRRLLRADGTELDVTATEFDLLAAFANHTNCVLSRERLLDLVHARDGDVFDRSIDVRVARIRRNVECNPANPHVIKTMRGAGYMLVVAKA